MKIDKGFWSKTINGIVINSSIPCSSKNYNNRTSRDVKYIVMHYTGNSKDTAKNNAKYFASGYCAASAHFFVDDATIYQSVELRDIAWHCGTKYSYFHKDCRNTNSIGIEMCCTAGGYRIGEAAKRNSEHLCAELCRLLGITAAQVDTYVLRHYDVTHKSCPAQMVSDEKEWEEFKDHVKALLTTGVVNPSPAQNYKVKVTANTLNVRKGVGVSFDIVTTIKKGEVYTIVKEKDGWGKLKSGVGWISLKYTAKI